MGALLGGEEKKEHPLFPIARSSTDPAGGKFPPYIFFGVRE
jgi:hypothetical protein